MAIKYVNNELEYEYEDGLAIKRKPERKKSTAARKADVQSVENGIPDEANLEYTREHGTAVAIGLQSRSVEGSSAPPVDTPSRTFRTRAPNGTFDRKEYNKIYQRAYRKHQRAKKKAEQENASE